MIYTHVAAALMAAALSASGAWWVQDARYAKKEKIHVEQHAQEERELHALESRRQSQLATAQSLATERTTKLRADFARSRDAIERLRGDIAEANVRIAQAPGVAVAEYATAANLVLADCSRQYLGVAEAAQGHANDVRLMQEAAQ